MKFIIYNLQFIICFCSCTKTVYLPVESVRTEYRDIHTRDSISLQDSVYIKEKGDTVWIERFRYLYRDRWKQDSVFLQDTIRVPYPVERIVYKSPMKWYYWVLGFFVVSLFFFIFRR